jgi:hypothetical protein
LPLLVIVLDAPAAMMPIVLSPPVIVPVLVTVLESPTKIPNPGPAVDVASVMDRRC